ncbi:MAG: hypothetical protein KGJ06_06740 [Pseudomonadota bacterium]|nr:hypothetical protein [Pseudomonadota bacterium]
MDSEENTQSSKAPGPMWQNGASLDDFGKAGIGTSLADLRKIAERLTEECDNAIGDWDEGLVEVPPAVITRIRQIEAKLHAVEAAIKQAEKIEAQAGHAEQPSEAAKEEKEEAPEQPQENKTKLLFNINDFGASRGRGRH